MRNRIEYFLLVLVNIQPVEKIFLAFFSLPHSKVNAWVVCMFKRNKWQGYTLRFLLKILPNQNLFKWIAFNIGLMQKSRKSETTGIFYIRFTLL